MEKIVSQRRELLEGELDRIVKVIIKEYSPLKIILFGSLTNTYINEHSDINLAIIKDTGERFIERLHKVHLLTRPNVAVNFIVYTPQEIKYMEEEKHYFYTNEIAKKGKILYETAA